MANPTDDALDGCDIDFTEHALPDEEAEIGVTLFADVPADQVDEVAAYYREVFEDA